MESYDNMLIDSPRLSESSDFSDMMECTDIMTSSCIISNNMEFHFKTYQELYNYVEYNSTFDGIFHHFILNKNNHMVDFTMRDIRSIVDTIIHHHMNR